tara:strand:+ start:2012 stop:2224 length:213 start_codon:yes stop_codon:yes gene_type:complete
MKNETFDEFSLLIRGGNAAFEESSAEEVARILEKLAGSIRQGEDVTEFDGRKLLDYNGNSVGIVKVRGED